MEYVVAKPNVFSLCDYISTCSLISNTVQYTSPIDYELCHILTNDRTQHYCALQSGCIGNIMVVAKVWSCTPQAHNSPVIFCTATATSLDTYATLVKRLRPFRSTNSSSKNGAPKSLWPSIGGCRLAAPRQLVGFVELTLRRRIVSLQEIVNTSFLSKKKLEIFI